MANLKDLIVNGAARILGGLNVNGDLASNGNIISNGSITTNQDLIVAGSGRFTKTTDADGGSKNSPAIIIGNETGEHIEIDTNEIMAKSSGSATAALYLNHQGGAVYANNRRVMTGNSVGNGTQPVYIDGNGYPQPCTSYGNASVNYANYAGYVSANNGLWKPVDGGVIIGSSNTAVTTTTNCKIIDLDTNSLYFLIGHGYNNQNATYWGMYAWMITSNDIYSGCTATATGIPHTAAIAGNGTQPFRLGLTRSYVNGNSGYQQSQIGIGVSQSRTNMYWNLYKLRG